jgi:hypothetical protein
MHNITICDLCAMDKIQIPANGHNMQSDAYILQVTGAESKFYLTAHFNR